MDNTETEQEVGVSTPESAMLSLVEPKVVNLDPNRVEFILAGLLHNKDAINKIICHVELADGQQLLYTSKVAPRDMAFAALSIQNTALRC